MPPTTPPPVENALLQGTLDLLVLKTLTWGPRHGYAIARWIEETTDDSLEVQEGSLYPALYRLKQRRLVTTSWGRSDLGRRIKLYELTTDGRAHLKALITQWDRCVVTMAKVLEATR